MKTQEEPPISQNADEEKFQDLPSGLTAGTCFGNVIFFVFIAMYLYVFFLFWNIFIIFSPYFKNLNGNEFGSPKSNTIQTKQLSG